MLEDKTYRWDRNSVSNLLQDRTGRPESRGCHLLANVVVDNHRSDSVEDNFEGLKHDQSLGEVARLLHLSEKTEEGNVGTVSEHNVRDSAECTEEVRVNCRLEVNSTLVLNTDSNHCDDDSSQDTEEGY